MRVTDDEIDAAFAGANFGGQHPKDALAVALLKCAFGYQSGMTVTSVAQDLGLVASSGKSLTKSGKSWLRENMDFRSVTEAALASVVK